jgi:peptidoglycan/LPS O-acetylase OafA/YrhL
MTYVLPGFVCERCGDDEEGPWLVDEAEATICEGCWEDEQRDYLDAEVITDDGVSLGAEPGGRRRGVDVLRGAAIVAMVVDHLAWGVAGLEPLRWSVGRLAMPLFVLCMGAVATRPLSRRRAWQWAVAAVFMLNVHDVAFPGSDGGGVLLLQLLFIRALWVRAPGLACLLSIGSLTAWANGYPLGAPFSTWAMLVIAGAGYVLVERLNVWGERWRPGAARLEWLGRRSLAIYVGHIVVLALARGMA